MEETTTAVGAAHADGLASLGENVIYLMGFTFVLGSLTTILALMLLEVLRRNRGGK